MANKRLLGSVALAAGLLGGGVAGVILGVPGVSGAQTTTVPNSPSTTAPADGSQTTPDRPAHDGKNCPHMDGQAPDGTTPRQAPGGATNQNLGFHRGSRYGDPSGAGGRV